MAYTKQDWRRLKSELIPVEPENLEQIEDGIVELESRIQAGLGEVETTTTTTKADYLMEKPTEDFKVIEKIPLKEGTIYEIVVAIDGVESSYSAQLVDGADLNLDYYDLTGFKVLICGNLSDTTTRGLIIVQDCIASLSPLNATSIEGYSSIYSSYDKVVIKDAYVDTETTHKIKNQDEKYTKAFQADALCTDEKDISFIKNNPIQKELVKTKKRGYKVSIDTTNFDLPLEGDDDIIKIGFIKDTVVNSKINFEADPLTFTVSSIESEPETFELIAMSGEELGLPKAATIYFDDDFLGGPFIIRGLTKVDFETGEFVGAVNENGLPLYDADGEMVADDNALFIFAMYYPESMRAIMDVPMITINETVADEVEEEHFKINEQFVEDFQADFAEGDSTKIGFIKNMPFYSANKNLPGFTIDEPLAAGEEFRLLTGTTKNSLILDKEGNYEVALLKVFPDGTTDTESPCGFFPGIVYNRTELLEIMQADNFAYRMSESEINALDSVLPADSAMLVVDTGNEIIPLIFTHAHLSIASNGALQVVTDENVEENYFTYTSLRFDGTKTVINITGKNIPENNYKIKQIKKLPSEFISVADFLDPCDSEKAVSGYSIWSYLNNRVGAQVLSTSDGHINFVKAKDGSQNINFSVETVGIGYNEDLQTTDKDTIVGAINELVSDINENKLQVADSGINNIYYTDKNGKPQEQLLKQNFVAAADDHTCYEALLDDTNIYWCPPYYVYNYIFGFSTKTFNVYSLSTSTKSVAKIAVVKDIEIKDTLTQAFASSSIICVNLHTSSTTEEWVHKSSLGSAFDRQFTEPLGTTRYLEIYMTNKQCVSVGFSDGIIKSATVTDVSAILANLPVTLKKTGASLFSVSSSTGSTRTETRGGRRYTVTKYYATSYRRNVLTQGAVMGGTANTGVNYILKGTSSPTTYGNTANSNLQLIITGDNTYKIAAQRSLNSEGAEIYSYEGTEYTGIDNNTHSTYIFLKPSESEKTTRPFCLTSAGEAIWRNLNTGEILARKTIQTDSSDLFAVTTLRTAKLYYCAENSLLYVVNNSSIYVINIFDENPIATIIKAKSTDDFTFSDDCHLIDFGENFVLLTNGSTLKVVQMRESFNCNELKLGDTAQDKIVLKDAETGVLYNLVIRNGQVVVTAVTS